MNKMNDRHKMPTADLDTFACLNVRSTASQAKEPFFEKSLIKIKQQYERNI
jgi:hypothetical protein